MTQTVQEAPAARLIHIMDGCLVAQLIHVAAELGLADLLADGPRSVTELAEHTGTEPDALARALRLLATEGVFTEAAPGAFGLTPLAEVLRTGAPDSVRDLVRIRGSREFWTAVGELGHSVATGRSSFEHAFGVDWWSYLSGNTALAALFNQAMGANVREVHAAVVDACDLAGVRRVVDVGGGHGYLTAALLRRHPELTAVVFDRPPVVAGAEQALAGAGVADRAEVVGGDFFQAVPGGGDVYLLCRILHDWDDRRAREILTAVRRELRPGARVVVVDSVVPPGEGAHPAKPMDLIMLALHEGKERTEAEFADLFAACGLRLTAVEATATPISLVVGELATPYGRGGRG